MGYDRYTRGDHGQRDDFDRSGEQRWDRDDGYSSDRMGRDDGRDYRGGYGNQRYGQREQMNRGIDYGRGYDAGERDYYRGDRGGYGERGGYVRDDRGPGQQGRPTANRDGYGERHPNDRGHSQQRGYGAQPQGYRYEDRGFLERAGDEVRSWFGDEEAERRRDRDARLDERFQNDRDSDYGTWRRGQIDALDRDYHEYRQENRARFDSEFGAWRTNRQTQRASLNSVKEHMEVVGADGSHVGTVDKVRGDRIVLTKNDQDAGGHHHSIPSIWLAKVDDKVTLSKTADEAKRAWRDEENRSLIGGQGAGSNSWSAASSSSGDGRSSAAGGGSSASTARENGRTDLNKSFSGTY